VIPKISPKNCRKGMQIGGRAKRFENLFSEESGEAGQISFN
jgi:hypothetical protein